MTTDQKVCVNVANVVDSCGTNIPTFAIIWSSSNPSVATVTSGGTTFAVVRGQTVGTTTITATITPPGASPFDQTFPVNVTSIGNPQSNNLICGSFDPVSLGLIVSQADNITCGSYDPINLGLPVSQANNTTCGSYDPIGSIGSPYDQTNNTTCGSLNPVNVGTAVTQMTNLQCSSLSVYTTGPAAPRGPTLVCGSFSG